MFFVRKKKSFQRVSGVVAMRTDGRTAATSGWLKKPKSNRVLVESSDSPPRRARLEADEKRTQENMRRRGLGHKNATKMS
ncbi:hypothetical protein RB195_004224 [Necator americanus]|uniref:Uncharacterized protein n=1 Tax=Necator americanus TaxID=51031 RepID=A0ABR1BIZ7_NECAM